MMGNPAREGGHEGWVERVSRREETGGWELKGVKGNEGEDKDGAVVMLSAVLGRTVFET